MVKFLLLHGAAIEPRLQGASERTPLYSASEAGHVACVEELLRRGAVVDRAGADGDTPLGRAAYCGHAAVVSLLLSNHASIVASNDGSELGGMTPLDRAVAGRNSGSHSDAAVQAGKWAETIHLLQQAAERKNQLRTPKVLWAALRDAVRVRPYALHWYSEWESKRNALKLDISALGLPQVENKSEKAAPVLTQVDKKSTAPAGGTCASIEASAASAAPASSTKLELGATQEALDEAMPKLEASKLASSNEELRERLRDGHLLMTEELELLEAEAMAEEATSTEVLRERLRDGHLLTAKELKLLEAEAMTEQTTSTEELRERLRDGHLLMADQIEVLEASALAKETEDMEQQRIPPRSIANMLRDDWEDCEDRVLEMDLKTAQLAMEAVSFDEVDAVDFDAASLADAIDFDEASLADAVDFDQASLPDAADFDGVDDDFDPPPPPSPPPPLTSPLGSEASEAKDLDSAPAPPAATQSLTHEPEMIGDAASRVVDLEESLPRAAQPQARGMRPAVPHLSLEDVGPILDDSETESPDMLARGSQRSVSSGSLSGIE